MAYGLSSRQMRESSSLTYRFKQKVGFIVEQNILVKCEIGSHLDLRAFTERATRVSSIKSVSLRQSFKFPDVIRVLF